MKTEKKYIRGKGYMGICPVCGEPFIGKYDKLYHPECKIALNNQIASKRNKLINSLKRKLIINDEALKRFHSTSRFDNGVPFYDLKSVEFVTSIFSAILKSKDDFTYYIINEYAYRVDNENKKIHIVKTNQIR